MATTTTTTTTTTKLLLLLLLTTTTITATTTTIEPTEPTQEPPAPANCLTGKSTGTTGKSTEKSGGDLPPEDLRLPENATKLNHITDFGLTLFRNLFPYNETMRNFFFSPYSVWSALSLAYFGSEGETKDQLMSALMMPDKTDAVKSWKSVEFLYKMRSNQTNYTFKIANRAYFDETVQLNTCLQDIFPSELQQVDFNQAQEASDSINEFISNTTKGRIRELVSPDLVSGARMVLVNAASFKGQWLYQFKPSDTSKGLFYSTMEDYVFVDMMRLKGNFRFGVSEELGANILELPYAGEAISMYILLPPFLAGENGFNAMVERLTGPLLHQAIQNTWRTQLEVVIPKFKLRQSLESELITALAKMGITDLFDPARANLSTFTEAERLSVGRSVHKSYLEVNEEGSEAAAATAFITWRIARPVNPTKFEAVHPFLFFIYDNLTDNVLFLGAYKNPRDY